ncbi:MAG TPA: sodium:calcium antiporter [bacterium]|nr:sodium:calcium antiporter [bacterium]HPL95454.1 sodium:calcium antiporter [bacterium]
MWQNLFILIVSLFLIVKGAMLSTKHAARLAKNFQVSKYVIGFIVVAIISILPETFVAINSSLEGVPAFGLGALFGSNVADLTLVFVIIIALSGRNIKVESKILKNNIIYPFLFLIPLILGLDGYYSRLEGGALIVAGAIFYYLAYKKGQRHHQTEKNHNGIYKNALFLILGMAILLIGAHFTVTSATDLAHDLKITPILIGMLIVGLGTTIPETIFSLEAVKNDNDSLAVGDILGTVLADATVVVGLIAIIKPFFFPINIIYVTGVFMLLAAFMVAYFMRTGKTISKKESVLLFFFWLIFIFTEYFINH